MEKAQLLLLPGLLNDASLFQHQVEHLSDLVTITIGSLCESDSIAALADDVLAQGPAGPLILGGMSMGGYVALEIVRRVPERIRALVLMSTSARPETRESTASRQELLALARTNFPAVIEKLLARMALPENANTPEVGGMFQSMANGLGREVFERQQQAIMGRSDSRPTLAMIRCPTLVICGRNDEVTPPEVNGELAKGIAGARLEVLDECGHLAPLEQPERVTELLREWLKDVVGVPVPETAAS